MYEKRLDGIDNKIEKISETLNSFGNKLFNGYGKQIDNIEKTLEALIIRQGNLEDIQIACKASQLAKDEIIKKYENRLKIYLTVLAIIASFPIWNKLIGG